ncbi:MAG: 2Fe-2S iron-sulfur cluster binding domain-containing protein [Alphaproteobacteria bacterium]|nr:2Fe-2S iron-sulfur cluster binding domain-containing protein [Alphaproteobacteria bacterium]
MTFQVSVQGTELRFPCEPNESVLDAAQRAGFEIPFSCRKGVCGTCKGRLVSGETRAYAGDALGDADKAAGQVLFCNTRPRSDLVIAPRSIGKADPFARKTVDARVFRLTRLADDVMLVHLRFPAGIRVRFRAGQHLNLILANGERRDFSMANPPRESDGAQLHIRHVPGGAFTSSVFTELKRGDILRAEIPFGDFMLRDSSKPILFVAGSTGFAPIKSIIEDMVLMGVARDAWLYWGARRQPGLYSELPKKWASQNPRFKYVPVLSDEAALGIRHNLVHRAVLEDHPSLAGFEAYVCGVPAMTQAAHSEFLAAGLPRDAFFADAFVTRADVAAAGP